MRVFVYGTLKQGWHNHRLLRDATFLGPAITATPFVLLDAGFPVMTPVGCGGNRVRGEVYEFDNPRILKALDQLEAEGRMYDRVVIEVLDAEGTAHEVWTYVGCADAFKINPLGVEWLTKDGVFDYRFGFMAELVE